MNKIYVTVELHTLGVSFEGGLTCSVTPQDGYLSVLVTLPPIRIWLSVKGSERLVEKVTGVCIVSVSVDTTATTVLSGAGMEFEISEYLALKGGTAVPRYRSGTFSGFTVDSDGVNVGCIGGFADDVLSFVSGGLFSGEESLSGELEDALTSSGTNAIQQALRASSSDPLSIQGISVSDQDFIATRMVFGSWLDRVRITTSGLVGTVVMSIHVVVSSPEVLVDGIPTIPLTPGAEPELPLAGNRDAFFVASDEAFGLLFASLTVQGHASTQCTRASPRVFLGDLLPDDCSALDDAAARGRCHGAKGDDCAALPPDEADICRVTAQDLADRNISEATEVLFCSRASLAARMLFEDDPSTPDSLESRIHLNDMAVSMVLDLDGSGNLAGSFLETPACFGLLPGAGGSDCRWAQGCFDVDLQSEVRVVKSPQPIIYRNVHGVSDHVGFQCAGGVYFGDPENLVNILSASDPITVIGDNLGTILPNFRTQGLQFGGLLVLTGTTVNPLAIDTGLGPQDDCTACDEFVGLTGELEIAP